MQWNISRVNSFSNQEIPFDIDELLKYIPPEAPESEWQALMEAPPGREPAEVKNLFSVVCEIVKDCIDLLLDQDKYIVEAIAYERITYEELGCRLGCSAPHAWRLKQVAYQNLKEVMVVDGRILKLGYGNG